MVFREIYEAMKLRKRFIIILTILSLVFMFQTLYFYSNPSPGNYEESDHIEVVKTPLKSTYNKTIINTRNLFQGIKLHREIARNNDAIKSTLLPTTFNDSSYETTSPPPELNTSGKSINISKAVGNSKSVPWKRSVLKSHVLDGFNNRSNSHLKSSLRRNVTKTNFSSFGGKFDTYSKFNLTKSNRPDYKKSQDQLRFEIDREVFAADSNFRNVGFNEQVPLKKYSNQTEELDNVENPFKKSESPSEFNFRTTSVKDNRILGISRDQLSRDEILFGKLRPRNISQLKDEVRIVSMSLYGAEAHYMVGAIENAKLVKKNFPGWKLRFYVESPLTKNPKYGQVPLEVLENLRSLGADIHYIIPEEDFLPPMMWRFLIADDPSVDRFIVRDCDSRLTKRDFASVLAWMRSGQAFQCTRDHPSHAGQSVSGGLWGGASHKLRIILRSSWIEAMRGRSSNYFSDMDFLQGHIWPRVVSHAYCSDSISCDRWPNSFPFPVPRYGYDHVGEVYDERGIGRKVDIRILQRQGENEACLSPPQD